MAEKIPEWQRGINAMAEDVQKLSLCLNSEELSEHDTIDVRVQMADGAIRLHYGPVDDSETSDGMWSTGIVRRGMTDYDSFQLVRHMVHDLINQTKEKRESAGNAG